MTEPAPERPVRRDVARNRERILAAARRLAATEGLGIGHDAIAHAAEVGVGTVYRHFPDREELIDLLFDERVGEVVALAEAAREAADPWEGLVGFLAGNLELQSGDRGLRELMAGTGRSAERARRTQARVGRAVRELVERAHASGQLRQDVGLGDFPLVQIMVAAVVEVGAEVDPERWRRALALVLDGYRADHVPRPPLPGAAATPEQVERLLSHDRPRVRRS